MNESFEVALPALSARDSRAVKYRLEIDTSVIRERFTAVSDRAKRIEPVSAVI